MIENRLLALVSLVNTPLNCRSVPLLPRELGTPGRALSAGVLLGAAVLSGGLLSAQVSSVRDSAGIRIVTNPARSATPVVFKLGDKPLIRVGGLEDDTNSELDFKNGSMEGVRLSSGGLVVTDNVRLQFFDANSRRVKILGRKGAGPQEFRHIESICRTRGDTLIVADLPNGRLAIVDGRNAEFVRTIPLMKLGSLPSHGCFEDGTFLMKKQTGPTATVEHLTRRRTDGAIVTELGDFARPHLESLVPSFVRFGAFGNQFVVSNTFTNDLLVHSAAGKLTSIVRSSDPLIRATSGDLQRLAERLAATDKVLNPNKPTAWQNERVALYLRQARFTTFPAHYEVLAEANGQLWVQDYAEKKWWTGGWTAFDANGKIIGRLTVPSDPDAPYATRVLGFGANEILIKTFDPDGAVYLSVYPLVRVAIR